MDRDGVSDCLISDSVLLQKECKTINEEGNASSGRECCKPLYCFSIIRYGRNWERKREVMIDQ
jgi:hypothetical protein